MKISKKITVAVCILAALPVFLILLSMARVFALTDPGGSGNASVVVYTADWIDRSNIKVTGSDGTSTIVNDGKWDGNWDYTGTIEGGCQVEINGFKSDSASSQPGYQTNWGPATSVATITVQRIVGTSCSSDNAPGFKSKDFPIGNPPGARVAFFAADANTIERIDDSANWSFTKVSQAPSATVDRDATWYVRSSEANSSSCKDYISVLPGGTQMKLYENTVDDSTKIRSPIDNNCWLRNTIGKMDPGSGDVDEWAYQVPSNLVLSLESTSTNNSINDVLSSAPIGSNPDGNACENLDNSSGFNWLFCGFLRGLDGFMSIMNHFIQSQLTINVDQTLNANVHQAWSIFRTIASALLVIIMLVMVFSQAISAGPFDAYTVKKMLPRLVAAVIFIQISWYFTGWAVGIANDLGKGIGQLVAAPFGGTGQLGLDKLTGQVGKAAPFGLATGGLAAVFIASAITPFGALMVAFMILLGVITATLVLLVRQALIIGAAIFFPLALVAWILPGTQKYWKMLWENFTKALLLFPIIMGIIYVGRVFAWIIGTENGSFTANALGVFAVAVGYFGPYFILPKTFSMGGSLMKMAANNIESGLNKTIGEKGKKFLQSRAEELKNERIRGSQERYSNRVGFDPRRPWRRPIDLLRSGQMDPTRWGRRREESMRNYRAAGVESEEKEMKAANQDFGQFASQAAVDQEYGGHDQFARDVAGAEIGSTIRYKAKDGRWHELEVNAAMKRAGMNGLAKFGTDRGYRHLARIMHELNHGTPEEQILAERFRDDQVGTLKPKMDYLYRGQSRVPGGTDEIPDWVIDPATGVGELSGPVASRVSALTPESFATMEAPELEAVLAGLSQVANHHADANARAAAEANLRTIYARYEAALDNDQIRRAMGPSLNQTMKAHLDGTNLAARNADRLGAGLTTEIEQVATLAPTTVALAGRIEDDGTVH